MAEKDGKIKIEAVDSESSEDIHNIKIGKTFQLQTKSFWISLVSILCIFLLALCSFNLFFCLKTTRIVMEHEEKLLETIMKTPLTLEKK